MKAYFRVIGGRSENAREYYSSDEIIRFRQRNPINLPWNTLIPMTLQRFCHTFLSVTTQFFAVIALIIFYNTSRKHRRHDWAVQAHVCAPLSLLPNFGLMGYLDIRGYISLEHEHEGGECFKSESVSAIMTGQMTKITLKLGRKTEISTR